ncbi:MAG: hypothetical protein R2701_09500 [Acidimicrobiales bacterium]|nr:hypothetical protein [Acidimicrobiales bacterium]
MGRSIVIGVAVAAVVSFLAVCATVLAEGESLGSAIGLGLFIAFWGGLGFGAMVGGVVFASRVEREGHGTH